MIAGRGSVEVHIGDANMSTAASSVDNVTGPIRIGSTCSCSTSCHCEHCWKADSCALEASCMSVHNTAPSVAVSTCGVGWCVQGSRTTRLVSGRSPAESMCFTCKGEGHAERW